MGFLWMRFRLILPFDKVLSAIPEGRKRGLPGTLINLNEVPAHIRAFAVLILKAGRALAAGENERE